MHIVAESSVQGLRCRRIRFEVLPGWSCAGLIFLPEGRSRPAMPGAVCIHGTDHDLGKWAVADPQRKPNAPYAIELARQGYVTIAVDQFGFGDWIDADGCEVLYRRFFAEHPEWSLDGIRLQIQRCAVSVLQQVPGIDGSRIACIGNSLGGRSALHLAAFDERIRIAVVSTGVSPNLTNVYRNTATDPCVALSPLLNAALVADGRPPWDYEEMLALVAPRGLILIEPTNDPYNPSPEATMACFLSARQVYALLDAPQAIVMLCHGLGHGTPAVLRRSVYDLMQSMWTA